MTIKEITIELQKRPFFTTIDGKLIEDAVKQGIRDGFFTTEEPINTIENIILEYYNIV